MLFFDRKEAGQLLAAKLTEYKNQRNVLILGLARGGVVLAFEMAKRLSLPLNVVVPRKIGAPDNPEFAIGAIMENGEGFFNSPVIHALEISQNYIQKEIEKEKHRAQQRLKLYRQYAPMSEIQDKTIILVDDGIATGFTMLAVVNEMRKEKAKKIIVAVPVSSTEGISSIEEVADEVVCLYSTEHFGAVGMYYTQFFQVEDEEVIELLKEIARNKDE